MSPAMSMTINNIIIINISSIGVGVGGGWGSAVTKIILSPRSNESAQMFRCPVLLLAALQILGSADATSNSSAANCKLQSTVGYASTAGCTFQSIQKGPLRVLYMDEQYVTQNPAAIAKVQALGMNYSFGVTCDDPTTAVPEWLCLLHWLNCNRNSN